jgi:hypothetical protein
MRDKVSRDSVIAAARAGAKDFRELSSAVGEKWSPEWEGGIRTAVDGIGDLLYRNMAVSQIQAARAAGDEKGVGTWRRAIFAATCRFMDAGIPCAAPAMMPSSREAAFPVAGKACAVKPKAAERKFQSKVPKPHKESVDVPKLLPVAAGEVDGKALPPLVLGATGKEYHGRKVVAVKRVAGIFGTKAGARGGPQLCTLRNGLVNQCSMKEPPTPYWAAMDAASGLKTGFTREQVVEEALKLLGKGVSRRGVEIAWDVLKNHQYHPRKRDCGMGFVVDQAPGRGKVMSVRARDEGETQVYFEAQRQRAKGGEKAPRVAGPEPAEQKPVAVVVEKKM